jgi:hypothetical protein
LTDFGDYDLTYFVAKFKAVFEATNYMDHYTARMRAQVLVA